MLKRFARWLFFKTAGLADAKATYASPARIALIIADNCRDDREQLMGWAYAKDEDLTLAHHGLWTNIRNSFGMWEKDNPYLESSRPRVEGGVITDELFPDNACGVIMRMARLECLARLNKLDREALS